MMKLFQVPALEVEVDSVAAANSGVNIIFLSYFDRKVHLNAMKNICPVFDFPKNKIFRFVVQHVFAIFK